MIQNQYFHNKKHKEQRNSAFIDVLHLNHCESFNKEQKNSYLLHGRYIYIYFQIKHQI